jgi:hypothetical protein
MDNVHNFDSYINILSPQTCRPNQITAHDATVSKVVSRPGYKLASLQLILSIAVTKSFECRSQEITYSKYIPHVTRLLILVTET